MDFTLHVAELKIANWKALTRPSRQSVCSLQFAMCDSPRSIFLTQDVVQCVLEAGARWPERAEVLPAQDSVPVNQVGRRHPDGEESCVHAFVRVAPDRVRHAEIAGKALDLGFVAARVDAHANDLQSLRRMLGMEFLEVRNLFLAGQTPCGSHVE